MSSFFSLIIFLNYFILIITIAPKDSNEDFDYLILVNKFYKLPDDYENKVNLVNATNNITDDNRTFLIENETYIKSTRPIFGHIQGSHNNFFVQS